jgi:hypothetical protein
MAETPKARTFTVDDWKALHFAYTLVEQVSLHGKPALDTFLAATREMQTPAQEPT